MEEPFNPVLKRVRNRLETRFTGVSTRLFGSRAIRIRRSLDYAIGMDVSALHGRRLLAAVVFVAATLVLAVQLITPSPVMVSIGENGTQTTELGQYFTYVDVGIITTSACVLGSSGTYLLFENSAPRAGSTDPVTRQATPNGGTGLSHRWEPDPADSDEDDGRSTVRRSRESIQQEEWQETLDRLRNNEETVYTVVLDAGGELPQRDVVDDTDLSKATVSRTLDTLESKGLVERKRRGMGNLVVLQ